VNGSVGARKSARSQRGRDGVLLVAAGFERSVAPDLGSVIIDGMSRRLSQRRWGVKEPGPSRYRRALNRARRTRAKNALRNGRYDDAELTRSYRKRDDGWYW